MATVPSPVSQLMLQPCADFAAMPGKPSPAAYEPAGCRSAKAGLQSTSKQYNHKPMFKWKISNAV